MSYKVSIIIPAFNEGKNINKILTSALNQTYDNFEVIVVDDGSQDNTGKICEKYKKKYSNFRYIYKENSGVSDARNLGLKYITGDYVCFWDADDWVEFNYLEKMLSAIHLTPSPKNTILVAGCIIDYYKENTKSNSEVLTLNNRLISKKEVLNYFLEEHEKYRLELWNKLFPAKVIKKKYFKSQFVLGEDFEFFTQCLNKIDYLLTVNVASYHYKVCMNQMKHYTPFINEVERERFIQKNLIRAGMPNNLSNSFYYRRLLITAYTALSYLAGNNKMPQDEVVFILNELRDSRPNTFKPCVNYKKAQRIMLILSQLHSPKIAEKYFKLKRKLKYSNK